ncbi:MAG TPA: PEP/pyruvate-binding domain-containing protein [Rubrobacteraceae bacterium]|nr:PEP/pyruvate-binding domain-containing protein [Rubrobacteraceae bacterium]
MTYTACFREIRRDDIALVGGKGANLGELSHAGLPVPPGFVVTTRAYDAFVEAGDLKEEIVGLASQADDPAAFEAAEERIRALFARGEVPDDVAAEIRTAYDRLANENGQAVAVRSSATAEDLPGASFAGQQDTYLNVRDAGTLMEAVRACWASLWTARAMAYRVHEGIDPAKVSLAVVVQQMVPAEAAGTLFTADPVSGRRDRAVIDAVWGLGEAVVGGQVTPDTLVVDSASGRMISRETADKEVMTVYTEDGGTGERPVPQARRRAPVLDDEAGAELARYGARIEDLYGAPQDIEWAYADGRFWVLQARPITKLPPPPLGGVRWEPPVPGSAWWRRQVVENLPEPLSPLFDELYLREGLERSIDDMMAYFGMTYLHVEDIIDRPMFATVNGYAYLRADYKLRWSTVPVILRATLDEFRMIFGDETAAYWREQALPSYLATIERWKVEDPASAPDERLLAGVRELALADARYWFACALMIARAKVTDALLGRFLATAAPGRSLISGMFLRGFPSPTVDAETELEMLAGQVRGSDELRALVTTTPAARLPEALESTPAGQAWLDAFARYLDRYGHQVYNLDFVAPTQADDPLPVLLSLKAMVQQPKGDPRARQRAILAERDIRVEETAGYFDPLRRRLFHLLLGWAQRFGPDREQALFYTGAGWPTLRRLALELGRRLVDGDSLLQEEDVFFLETSEIEAAIAARAAGKASSELARQARERRELREARKRLHPPPVVPPDHKLRFGPFDMSVWETQRRNEPAGAVLRGFAVSPGRVSAPASVIRSPDDFLEMEPGTILVCSTTTPAWTPLFSQARGLVTDVGGVLAHGSIVAREYGIPAVLGTGTATTRIRTGQNILVDGDAGTVTLLNGTDEADTAQRSPEPEPSRHNLPSTKMVTLFALAAGAVAAAWWRNRRRS